MANRRRGTLYCGVTSDLARRALEHRDGAAPGFTRTHGLHRLVWFEMHSSMYEAICREKRIKRWRRAWKYELIEERNPDWRDLSESLSPWAHSAIG
jgi:putative endonuclease